MPNTDPHVYLLPRTEAQSALDNLCLHYADLANWIHQEQTLNPRTVRPGHYPIAPTSVPPEFRPEQQPVFWLPEFEAPKDDFRLFRNPARPMPWYFSGSTADVYSHLVHPLSVPYFVDRQMKRARWPTPRFIATPTASHRTLLVWNPKSRARPFLVKTSVNIWIGGLNRNVRLKELRRTVGMSALFAEIPKPRLSRHGVLLLDDPVGLLHNQTNAGLLARDAPRKLSRGEEIAPIFSLLASKEGKPPRIVELVQTSGLDPITWVDEFILKPLIYQAYFLAMTAGLVGEMHEQNILMELRDGVPTKRFWQRDLGGFGVERALRRLAGKTFDELPDGVHERHLGDEVPLVHLLLRIYVQESLGYAVSYALKDYFEVPPDDFEELYNVRVSEFQDRILSRTGISQTKNIEKDLDRYRKLKTSSLVWPWKSLDEALRDW